MLIGEWGNEGKMERRVNSHRHKPPFNTVLSNSRLTTRTGRGEAHGSNYGPCSGLGSAGVGDAVVVAVLFICV